MAFGTGAGVAPTFKLNRVVNQTPTAKMACAMLVRAMARRNEFLRLDPRSTPHRNVLIHARKPGLGSGLFQKQNAQELFSRLALNVPDC
jgi:hypothetical protein